jgi:hypothetical protein
MLHLPNPYIEGHFQELVRMVNVNRVDFCIVETVGKPSGNFKDRDVFPSRPTRRVRRRPLRFTRISAAHTRLDLFVYTWHGGELMG